MMRSKRRVLVVVWYLLVLACGQVKNTSVSETSLAANPPLSCSPRLPEPLSASDLLGVNLDLANPFGRPDPQELTKIGVKWIRIEFRHNNNDYASVSSAYQGKPSSAQVRALKPYRDAGIKIVMLLDYFMTTQFYHPDMLDGPWTNLLADTDKNMKFVVGELASLVDVWQLWNEPDFRKPGYEPYMNPERFAQFLATSYKTIRTDSCAPIVLGGLANGDGGYYLKDVITKYRSANQSTFPFDAISIHPYGRGVNGLYEIFGTLDGLLDSYRRVALQPFGLDQKVKMVISEAGNNSSDESKFKPYLIGMYESAFKFKVPFMTWYAWDDRMGDGWGLQRADGSKRGTYEGMLALAQAAKTTP